MVLREKLKVPQLSNLNPKNYSIPANFNENVVNLGQPHVDSFDHFIEHGLAESVRNLIPIEFVLPSGDQVSITISSCSIGTPTVPVTVVGTSTRNIYPLECRQRKISYRGKCVVQLKWSVNGVPCPPIEKEMGELPIMFKSKLCNIRKFSPSQLVKVGEQEDEWGG